MGFADKDNLHIPYPSWAKDRDVNGGDLDFENWKELQRWADRLEPGGGGDKILLPIPGGIAPDESLNAAASVQRVTSSGSPPSDAPRVVYHQLRFDPGTDEHWLWPILLPGQYASGGTLRLFWGATVATGNVVWKAGIATGPSATDFDAIAFAATDTAAATAAPGTVGYNVETTIALTMTGAGPNQEAVLFVGRDANSASDTCTGDACLRRAIFEFTT